MRKSCMRPSLLLPRNKGVLRGLEFATRSAGISRLPLAILYLLATALFSSAVHSSAQGESSPSTQFSDVTESAGIKFVHFKGNQGTAINLEEFGPGVCVSDFNRDGWQDIYFVNGRDLYGRGITAKNALYRNNGDNTFTDVTDQAGVPGTGYGLGCAWGDFDLSLIHI